MRPCLSAVEWTAVEIYLGHWIARETAELETWRGAQKVARNAQTVASVHYHRTVLTALERMQADVKSVLDRLPSTASFPPPTALPIEVIERN